MGAPVSEPARVRFSNEPVRRPALPGTSDQGGNTARKNRGLEVADTVSVNTPLVV